MMVRLFSRDAVAKSPCTCGSLPGIYIIAALVHILSVSSFAQWLEIQPAEVLDYTISLDSRVIPIYLGRVRVSALNQLSSYISRISGNPACPGFGS